MLRNVLVFLWLYVDHGTEKLSDIPVRHSQTESNMACVKARRLCLLLLSNGFEPFCLRTAVRQPHSEKEHPLAELSCLSSGVEAVKAYSMETFFSNFVP